MIAHLTTIRGSQKSSHSLCTTLRRRLTSIQGSAGELGRSGSVIDVLIVSAKLNYIISNTGASNPATVDYEPFFKYLLNDDLSFWIRDICLSFLHSKSVFDSNS
jgi:hypothetical protein